MIFPRTHIFDIILKKNRRLGIYSEKSTDIPVTVNRFLCSQTDLKERKLFMKKKLLLLTTPIFALSMTSQSSHAMEPNSEEMSLASIPLENQLEILPYLPSRDLLKFRFVCKKWNEVIPQFISYLYLGFNKKLTDERMRQFNSEFPNLRGLNLCGKSNITDDSLSLLTNITKLNLESNSKIFDMSVLKLTNITNLNLQRNNNIIGVSFYFLSNLTALNLNENNTISRLFYFLTNLKSLSLRKNNTITDEDLSLLTNITSLDLIGNNTITDRSVSRLTNITDLHLWENHTITNASISRLTNITRLSFGEESRITDGCLSLLTNLTTLNRPGLMHISDRIRFRRPFGI